jgi:hypothetical protein
MSRVEQLGRKQVIAAEVVGAAPPVLGFAAAFELHAVPVAAFGELPPDDRGEVAGLDLASR